MSIIEKALEKLEKAAQDGATRRKGPGRLDSAPGAPVEFEAQEESIADPELQKLADEAVDLEVESEPVGASPAQTVSPAPVAPRPEPAPPRAASTPVGETPPPRPAPVPPTPRAVSAPPGSTDVVRARDDASPATPPRPPGAVARPRAATGGVAVADEAGEPPEARTGQSVELDLERLDRMGFITPNSSNTTLAEQHRLIKRPLLDRVGLDGKSAIENGNLIIITSSLPGEGKTFIAINLAMSIAMEVDRTVLLVDADIHKSDVSNILGIASTEGLTDYLQHGNIPLSSLLLRTNVPKLTVLPAGRRYPNLTELIASENMRALTHELASRYRDRIIVFDSPPLLATSGASVLVGLMGQVVMVVEAVRTAQSAVTESLGLIGAHPHLGIVLNKSRQRARAGYRYDYYYYGEQAS